MTDIVRQIADELLYQGYQLWPYDSRSIGDEQRRIFGCVLPRHWSQAHPPERSTIGTECLVDGTGARVEVRARFLQVVQRQVLDSQGAQVAELVCRGEQYRTGEEATEREVTAPGSFTFPAGYAREPLQGGALVRRWRRLDGRLDVSLEPPGSGPRRLSVSVINLTAWHGTAQSDALESSFCRVHLSLTVVYGAFMSPLDPRAACCHHDQLWPVLIGEAPDRSSILASGIMLEQYPSVAAARPSDSPRQRATGGRSETAWPRVAAIPGLH
jgi:hypothetical protein